LTGTAGVDGKGRDVEDGEDAGAAGTFAPLAGGLTGTAGVGGKGREVEDGVVAGDVKVLAPAVGDAAVGAGGLAN
jgi:hypothetical protein